MDVHRDRLPPPLIESHQAQQAPRRVANEDRDPDIDWIQSARPLNDEANPQRHAAATIRLGARLDAEVFTPTAHPAHAA